MAGPKGMMPEDLRKERDEKKKLSKKPKLVKRPNREDNYDRYDEAKYGHTSEGIAQFKRDQEAKRSINMDDFQESRPLLGVTDYNHSGNNRYWSRQNARVLKGFNQDQLMQFDTNGDSSISNDEVRAILKKLGLVADGKLGSNSIARIKKLLNPKYNGYQELLNYRNPVHKSKNKKEQSNKKKRKIQTDELWLKESEEEYLKELNEKLKQYNQEKLNQSLALAFPVAQALNKYNIQYDIEHNPFKAFLQFEVPKFESELSDERTRRPKLNEAKQIVKLLNENTYYRLYPGNEEKRGLDIPEMAPAFKIEKNDSNYLTKLFDPQLNLDSIYLVLPGDSIYAYMILKNTNTPDRLELVNMNNPTVNDIYSPFFLKRRKVDNSLLIPVNSDQELLDYAKSFKQ